MQKVRSHVNEHPSLLITLDLKAIIKYESFISELRVCSIWILALMRNKIFRNFSCDFTFKPEVLMNLPCI